MRYPEPFGLPPYFLRLEPLLPFRIYILASETTQREGGGVTIYFLREITKSRFQCSKGKAPVVAAVAGRGEQGAEETLRGHSRRVYRESFRQLSEDKDETQRSRTATMRTSLDNILQS